MEGIPTIKKGKDTSVPIKKEPPTPLETQELTATDILHNENAPKDLLKIHSIKSINSILDKTIREGPLRKSVDKSVSQALDVYCKAGEKLAINPPKVSEIKERLTPKQKRDYITQVDVNNLPFLYRNKVV